MCARDCACVCVNICLRVCGGCVKWRGHLESAVESDEEWMCDGKKDLRVDFLLIHDKYM